MAPLNTTDPRKTVTTRVEETLVEQLDEIAEQEGKSRSGKLRDLIRDEVTDNDGPDHDLIPEDEQLREAYHTLRDLADERIPNAGLRCTRQEAENALYSNRTPKNAVMRDLVKPLRYHEPPLVAIDNGMNEVWIVVRPLD